jgi:uncharacterized protein YqfA (UPF0365 family)
MSAVPAVVALHLMAVMFLFTPLPVLIITLALATVLIAATVLIVLRGRRFVSCRATTRIQRKNYLTNTEHKNKNYYRTHSSGHKLITPG